MLKRRRLRSSLFFIMRIYKVKKAFEATERPILRGEVGLYLALPEPSCIKFERKYAEYVEYIGSFCGWSSGSHTFTFDGIKQHLELAEIKQKTRHLGILNIMGVLDIEPLEETKCQKIKKI